MQMSELSAKLSTLSAEHYLKMHTLTCLYIYIRVNIRSKRDKGREGMENHGGKYGGNDIARRRRQRRREEGSAICQDSFEYGII